MAAASGPTEELEGVVVCGGGPVGLLTAREVLLFPEQLKSRPYSFAA